jgi:LysR family glycine cleavage system transcriptional activator
MSRRLPPLNALRAFEAGARHLSFTKAAEELHVTQAAVSHQVKALEEYLGVALFRRMTRQIALTEAGRALVPVLSESFDQIAAAAEALRERPESRTLTVTLTPAFGSKWLAGRLGRFWTGHPEIDLRLHHTVTSVDFAVEEVDMGVRWGSGDWPGLESEFLISVDVTPVCSPALLEGDHPLCCPEDLAHYTLLHEDDHEDWVQWFITAGLDGDAARRGPTLDDSGVLLRAAADGHGVALGRLSLIGDDLGSGRLVVPFDLRLEIEHGYHVVYRPGGLDNPKIKAFRDFLLAEIADDAAKA